ncbi:hypothetical protein [Parvularcula lutaonensis]|uniref:Secreted protein n=1 Tax=Parvularcula lutaonensis TaxID=491923 RepID=A0ABV7M8X7_9PROT|nr:hypothetical protein [Parvularcula lutaonensis]GGY41827.1 hypothetical protein GCM10007148_08060 [Parvularcula lutaonensis]
MQRWFGLLFLTAACASGGEVRLTGQFTTEAPPPQEVRVMLDPHYGHSDCSRHGPLDAEEVAASNPYRSSRPDDFGVFEPPAFPVERETKMRRLPEPSFFLGFSNERDVIYAVGRQHSALQYRAFDAATKEPLDRAGTCWKVVDGGYSRAKRSVALRIVIAPNFDSPKACLPPGTYAPGWLESAPSLEE